MTILAIFRRYFQKPRLRTSEPFFKYLEKWFETKIIDVCNRNYHVAYPDSDLQKIMDLMVKADVGRVPIVDRSRPTKIVGIVSKADIIGALERERTGSA